MTSSTIEVSIDKQRPGGWASLAAGIFGFAAFGFIIAALFIRTDARRMGALMFRWHDAMAVLQSLCMLSVVSALCAQAKRWNRPMSTLAYCASIAALGVLMVVLLLTLAHVVNDMLYMIPQGIFGVWMIWFGWHLTGLLPRHIRWLGTIAGVGLTLISLFPIAFGILVDPIVFRGPMPPDYRDVDSMANLVAHIMLAVGTLIGLPLYPLWSLAVGRMLLRRSA